MAPFNNNGKEFQYENEFDEVLPTFVQAIDLYDNAFKNRDRLIELRATVEFQKAYSELGSPEIWIDDQINPQEPQIIDPYLTLNLHSKLKVALENDDFLVWEANKLQFLENVIAEYKTAVNWICLHRHNQSIQDLINTIKDDRDIHEIADTASKLIELDLWFLTDSALTKIIRERVDANDKKFLDRLARTIDPYKKAKMHNNVRTVYALIALSCLGYREKPFSKWAEFFTYFNQQLGADSERLLSDGFPTLEKVYNIRRLVRDHKIDKINNKGGRPRKS